MKGLVSAGGAVKDMPDEPPHRPPGNRLPEEFAPTGPKLSRFPIQPAPPLRPRLFADEARFAARLALLAGASELAFWAWLLRCHGGVALAAGALRCARPLWASLGARVPRPAVAFALLAIALLAQGLAIVTVGQIAALTAAAAWSCALPALGDLASTCIADSVTVERRAAAFAWLDMGQGLGCALGVALALAAPGLVPLAAAAVLLVAGFCVPDLHDRGTPRSSWPLAAYRQAASAPLSRTLLVTAFVSGAAAAPSAAALFTARLFPPRVPEGAAGLLVALVPLAGMVASARAEPRMRNAARLPVALAAAALLSLAAHLLSHAFHAFPLDAILGGGGALLGAVTLGAACAALPASVARGAAELERPLVSGLVWTALALGAGLGRGLFR